MLVQFIANGILSGAVYAFVGLGFALVYRTSRAFPVAQAAVLVLAPYGALFWRDSLGQPLFLDCVLGVAGAVVVAAMLELGVDGRLRRAGASWQLQLLASLGQFIVLQNALSLFFGDETRSLRRTAFDGPVILGGARVTAFQLATAIVSVLLTGAVAVWLRWTRHGRSMRAVADAPDLADVYGVRRSTIILIAVCIGSTISGLAGCFIALDLSLNPSMGLRVLLMGLTAAVIGGVRSIGGILLGGLLLGIGQNLGVAWLPTEWQQAMGFAIMLGFLICRPQGFWGSPPAGEQV